MRPERWIPLGSSLIGSLAVALAGSPMKAAGPPPSTPLASVTVTASRLTYDRKLEHLAMRFVRAHAAPSSAIHQLGRWHEPVCPLTVGLKSSFGKLISRRIALIAERVGAPTHGPGAPCKVDVEIVFTPDAQGLVNHLTHTDPWLVGFPDAERPPTFHGPIESWYLTATTSLNGSILPDIPSAGLPIGAYIDVPGERTPGGFTSSRITPRLQSEFIYVLIIVDAHQVADYPLRAMADYIAMLAMTHMTPPRTCSTLPSITDLLAPGCTERPKPMNITAEDTAYLKALYASSLNTNLNVAQSEVRNRMLAAIERH